MFYRDRKAIRDCVSQSVYLLSFSPIEFKAESICLHARFPLLVYLL